MALAQARQTHCINGHPLIKGNLYVRRDGKRQCKICTRWRARKHQAKLRSENRAPHEPPEWHRQYRQDVKQGIRIPERRVRVTNPYTFRVLDVLYADGGWLTVPGLAAILDAKEDTIRRTLGRMRGRGWVESRKVPLATRSGRRGFDERLEWRAVADLDRFI